MEGCRACEQQAAGSRFLERLNAGDETPGEVSYTQITTRYDEVVVPHTSGYLTEGPRTTNLTLQDVCPLDTSDHLLIPHEHDDHRARPGRADPRGPGPQGSCDRLPLGLFAAVQRLHRR